MREVGSTLPWEGPPGGAGEEDSYLIGIMARPVWIGLA